MNNVRTAVRNTVEKVSGEVLSPEDEFKDISEFGCDWLDVIKICMNLEQRFNISIPDQKIENMDVMSVDNISQLIELYV